MRLILKTTPKLLKSWLRRRAVRISLPKLRQLSSVDRHCAIGVSGRIWVPQSLYNVSDMLSALMWCFGFP